MFARRGPGPEPPNRLTRALDGRRRAGAPVLDLTETNPTHAGIALPPGLLDALADPRAAVYQPAARGLRGAREAVAARYAARGTPIDPDHVVLTASTSEAYALLFKLLCDPGDAVLVPAPGYPLLALLARLEGIAAEPYPVAPRPDGTWGPDLAGLAPCLSERTRALVVVHPNFPSGEYLRPAERDALAALARRRDLALISDEVFADYPLDDAAAAAAAAAPLAPRAEVLTFSLGGLAKAIGLPQLKLGWLIAGGPAAERDQALARLDLCADAYLSVAAPVQHALPALLALGDARRQAIARRLRANRAHLAAAAAAAGIALLPAEGGWGSVLHLPGRDDEDLALATLERDGVLVHPGYFYDFSDDGFLVLSLLPPPEVFRPGVERLLARLAAAPESGGR